MPPCLLSARRAAALRLSLCSWTGGRGGMRLCMRRAATLRSTLLGMRRGGLIVMFAILRERRRSRDKADNRGRNEKFAHQKSNPRIANA